jgi:ABC-type cobalamin/Fe3+-siderophores transport system ATPase subunit
LEETAARRHQFVLGRRGVGKSTLLRKIQSQEQIESNVVFVDIETLRSRPYPDVLIELLIELLTGLGERLSLDSLRDVPTGAAHLASILWAP